MTKPCLRLSSLLAAAFLALPAHAAVTLPDTAITAEPGLQATKARGLTRHPVRVDRERIEASAVSGELMLPGANGAPVRARFSSLTRRPDGLRTA